MARQPGARLPHLILQFHAVLVGELPFPSFVAWALSTVLSCHQLLTSTTLSIHLACISTKMLLFSSLAFALPGIVLIWRFNSSVDRKANGKSNDRRDLVYAYLIFLNLDKTKCHQINICTLYPIARF